MPAVTDDEWEGLPDETLVFMPSYNSGAADGRKLSAVKWELFIVMRISC